MIRHFVSLKSKWSSFVLRRLITSSSSDGTRLENLSVYLDVLNRSGWRYAVICRFFVDVLNIKFWWKSFMHNTKILKSKTAKWNALSDMLKCVRGCFIRSVCVVCLVASNKPNWREYVTFSLFLSVLFIFVISFLSMCLHARVHIDLFVCLLSFSASKWFPSVSFLFLHILLFLLVSLHLFL